MIGPELAVGVIVWLAVIIGALLGVAAMAWWMQR